MGITSTDKCTFCLSPVENIQHLLCECIVTIRLWSNIQNKFSRKVLIPNLNVKSAFIGFSNINNDNYIYNHLLIFKKYVYSKRNTNVLNANAFIQRVTSIENLERLSIDDINHKSAFHSKKWSPIMSLLH